MRWPAGPTTSSAASTPRSRSSCGVRLRRQAGCPRGRGRYLGGGARRQVEGTRPPPTRIPNEICLHRSFGVGRARRSAAVVQFEDASAVRTSGSVAERRWFDVLRWCPGVLNRDGGEARAQRHGDMREAGAPSTRGMLEGASGGQWSRHTEQGHHGECRAAPRLLGHAAPLGRVVEAHGSRDEPPALDDPVACRNRRAI